MGTNYYVKKKLGYCDKCHRCDTDEVHVGKSSAGWQFLFNPYKPSFREWREFLMTNDGYIFDEYDREVAAKEILELIEEKQKRNSTHWRAGENPEQHEVRDADGYRISKYSEFS